MKIHPLLAPLAAALSLAACGGDSSTGPTNGSGRIDPAIEGTWAKSNATFATDTLILTATKYRTPFGSGTGSAFAAANGLAYCGPSLSLCGEYQLVEGGPKDTLYFKGLLGTTVPDATVPHSSSYAYFRIP